MLLVFIDFAEALEYFRLCGGAMNVDQTQNHDLWTVAPPELIADLSEDTPRQQTEHALHVGGMTQEQIAEELSDWAEFPTALAEGARPMQFDITPEQYHAGLTILWDALGNTPMDDCSVFQRAADRIADLREALDDNLAAMQEIAQTVCRPCHVGQDRQQWAMRNLNEVLYTARAAIRKAEQV